MRVLQEREWPPELLVAKWFGVEVKGVAIGCVDAARERRRFRHEAHAHISGTHRGWVCYRSEKTMVEGGADLAKHELAHLLTLERHTAAFREALTVLHGGVLPRHERPVVRGATSACRARSHGLCHGYFALWGVAYGCLRRRGVKCPCWCHDEKEAGVAARA